MASSTWERCVHILHLNEYLPAELSVGCPAPCGDTAPSSPAAASEPQCPSASAPAPTSGPQPEREVNVHTSVSLPQQQVIG